MTSPIPAGREALIPHLVCSPCRDAIAFYKKAFGAKELGIMPEPSGERIMHAEIEIGGNVVFLADDFPEYCGGAARTPIALGGTPVSLHRYVEDCDAAIEQAVQAGATVKMPASDMFWGDRYGVLTDPFGHDWSLATHKADLTPEEMNQAMRDAFAQSPAEAEGRA